ncbi:MAG: hypothetical protein A2W25_11125 [candidate division Zixibacteria bacterium RBG_16_53_22]|nr:MAG: hypothetical protein A2W25_11125 [candidate division Zixibacteria bacterium RBG_16_53_22]
MHIKSENPVSADHLIVDMFSGAGGFSVGFCDAGFGVALALDNHAPSKDTFLHNHKEASFILGDIRKVNSKVIRNVANDMPISVLVAGVPCQGFSLNNKKRKEDDERNFLFQEFIRFIKIFNPPYVLLENVSGLTSSGNGYFRAAIIKEIGACGYNVDFRILKAPDYGVPQKRARVFFQGARPGYDIRWPAPTHGLGRSEKYNTVYDAIGDLPLLGNGEEKFSYDKEPTTEYQKVMRKNSDGKLLNHRAPSHPEETILKIGNTTPGFPIYPRFPQRIRLKMDDLSPTQVSGGIRSQFTFGHPTQPRGLSIRERARIQSFPDHFFFCGGLVQSRVQTGNAVPPLLARAIAVQIMKGLKHEAMDDTTIKKDSVQMELV